MKKVVEEEEKQAKAAVAEKEDTLFGSYLLPFTDSFSISLKVLCYIQKFLYYNFKMCVFDGNPAIVNI